MKFALFLGLTFVGATAQTTTPASELVATCCWAHTEINCASPYVQDTMGGTMTINGVVTIKCCLPDVPAVDVMALCEGTSAPNTANGGLEDSHYHNETTTVEATVETTLTSSSEHHNHTTVESEHVTETNTATTTSGADIISSTFATIGASVVIIALFFV
jgi:hypothetical protein